MATYAYELWDLQTGNMIDAFGSEREALAAVRAAIERHGLGYVTSWALAHAPRRKIGTRGEGACPTHSARLAAVAGGASRRRADEPLTSSQRPRDAQGRFLPGPLLPRAADRRRPTPDYVPRG